MFIKIRSFFFFRIKNIIIFYQFFYVFFLFIINIISFFISSLALKFSIYSFTFSLNSSSDYSSSGSSIFSYYFSSSGSSIFSYSSSGSSTLNSSSSGSSTLNSSSLDFFFLNLYIFYNILPCAYIHYQQIFFDFLQYLYFVLILIFLFLENSYFSYFPLFQCLSFY